MRGTYFPSIKAGGTTHPLVCTRGLCYIFYTSLYPNSAEKSRSEEQAVLNVDEKEDLSLSVAVLVMPNLTMISGWVRLMPPSSTSKYKWCWVLTFFVSSDYCYLNMKKIWVVLLVFDV